MRGVIYVVVDFRHELTFLEEVSHKEEDFEVSEDQASSPPAACQSFNSFSSTMSASLVSCFLP